MWDYLCMDHSKEYLRVSPMLWICQAVTHSYLQTAMSQGNPNSFDSSLPGRGKKQRGLGHRWTPQKIVGPHGFEICHIAIMAHPYLVGG